MPLNQQGHPNYLWEDGRPLADAPVDFAATFEGAMWVTGKPIDVPAFYRNPLRVRANFMVPRHHHNIDETVFVLAGEYRIEYGDVDHPELRPRPPRRLLHQPRRHPVHDDRRPRGRHLHRDLERPRPQAQDRLVRPRLDPPLIRPTAQPQDRNSKSSYRTDPGSASSAPARLRSPTPAIPGCGASDSGDAAVGPGLVSIWARLRLRSPAGDEHKSGRTRSRPLHMRAISSFGRGMGSFQDLVLQDSNGVRAEQDELDRLRHRLFEEAWAALR